MDERLDPDTLLSEGSGKVLETWNEGAGAASSAWRATSAAGDLTGLHRQLPLLAPFLFCHRDAVGPDPIAH